MVTIDAPEDRTPEAEYSVHLYRKPFPVPMNCIIPNRIGRRENAQANGSQHHGSIKSSAGEDGNLQSRHKPISIAENPLYASDSVNKESHTGQGQAGNRTRTPNIARQ